MARAKYSTRIGFASGTGHPHEVTFEQRAVIYSPRPERTCWMEDELARGRIQFAIARSVPHVVAMLVGELQRGRRPAILVIDAEEMTGSELHQLRRVRESGWSGVMVVLGSVPPSLRKLLGIDLMLMPPFVENALCDEIARHARESTAITAPIPVF